MTFLAAVISGLGSGAVYALIAVSFVVIFRATGVLNFAQPGLLILGSWACSMLAVDAGLPFYLAAALAMLAVAAAAMLVERVAIRPMVGRPVFATALVTVGLFTVLLVLAFRLFDSQARVVNDPWKLDTICLARDAAGGCALQVFEATIGRFVVAMVVLGALGWWLARSRTGLAMRATALDQEAALAQGVNVGRIFSLAWAIGGALAALGGILLAANGSVIQATDSIFALVALPILIFGGLDSFKGGVIAGLAIGVLSAVSTAFQPIHAPWLGPNFENVAPYVVMFVILTIRPYGLFGTKEVRRV